MIAGSLKNRPFDAKRFQTIFADTASKLSEESEERGRISLDKFVSSTSISTAPAENRDFHREVKRLTGSAISSTLGPVSMVVAGEVGKLLITPEREKQHGEERHSAWTTIYGTVDSEKHTKRVSKLWGKICRHSHLSPRTPTLLNRDGLGAYATSTDVYVEKEWLEGRFSGDSTFVFMLAHELAHLENRDSSRRVGASQLLKQEGIISDRPLKTELGKERKQFDYQMELGADRRAVDIVAKMGLDPKPILTMLASFKRSEEHPDGMERASRLHKHLSNQGIQISKDEFQKLTNEGFALRSKEPGLERAKKLHNKVVIVGDQVLTSSSFNGGTAKPIKIPNHSFELGWNVADR